MNLTITATSRFREVDAAALARKLRGQVRGEVRFDDGSRSLYAADASNYRQTPIGVVIPRDADDVIATVALCREAGAPVLSRGGGTSLAGQCCNVAVVMDFSKYMNGIVEIDPQKEIARFQPGVVLDKLRAAAEKHNLTFGPDPATHAWCTLGGMIGNNSCGVHSIMAGKTVENIEELDVLLYDGTRMRVGATAEAELESIIGSDPTLSLREKGGAPGGRRGQIYRDLRALRDKYADLVRQKYPQIPRRVSGFNLDELLPERGFHVAKSLVGSEGTCAIVLEATGKLVYSPPARVLLVLGYEDAYIAADHVPELMRFSPIGLEGMDERLIRDMRKKNLRVDAIEMLPKGGGWLLLEFGGATSEEAAFKAIRAIAAIKRLPGAPAAKMFASDHEQKKIWEVRESGLGATAFVPGQKPAWEGWEDSAVAPEKLGGYLRELRALIDEYGYDGPFYGHFGHGCVHTRITFDLETAGGIAKYRSFVEAAADLCVRYDGSLSGEHGDGQSRGELLVRMYGPELVNAFREFKRIWDPDGRMNPGKMVDPYRLDENLRLGAGFTTPKLQTFFQFPEEEGDFTRATMRCVGVGKCRKQEGATMCPSYRVTGEERHTTRGRAHLLFEMLTGKLDGGWREESVKEALDLCLACKGCKGDCPVNVDVATYKAEFLAHYYEGRLRPRHQYAFGLIDLWARMASPVAPLVNFFTQTPGLSAIAKVLAGMPQQRTIPKFANQTFRDWFFARERQNGSGRPVILWADTFNNYFHPPTAQAAVEVLERAGYRVIVPREKLCCGRPLYDFGMLPRAKRLLWQTMEALRDPIVDGIPVIALEPSCGAVFRDELTALFPKEDLAQRLAKQTFLLSEFLQREKYEPPKLSGKAVVHKHCHDKSVIKGHAEEDLLRSAGLEVKILDSGCCGMAGSFGFTSEHYQVSQDVGELTLLPAVRALPQETLFVADGFSCREQVKQATGKMPLHLAEVLAKTAKQ